MNNHNNELRVFISSTFRDLQEERAHLIKKVFPEIRTLCRQRGITFTDIDLRWGLTEEQAVLGTVIRTCLEEVDKCRPYFIGLIGNRYGWTPEFHEIMMDPDLLAKYPWVENAVSEGISLTEMEFIHGVFDAPEVEGQCAFFYRRLADVAEADDPERLAALIERSRATGYPFREFRSLEEIGAQVRADLVMMIDRYWPQTEAPSVLELERRSQAAFAASRLRAYIPNPLYLKEFKQWFAESLKPLLIGGESGLGKSSLVAYLVDYYRKMIPKAFVIEHYVGASQTSGSAVSVMRHIIEEIRTRFGIDEDLPIDGKELEKHFPNWLFRCEHLAAQEGIPVLIMIDAVNQLDESGRYMSWLPSTIPQGIKLIISTTPDRAADQLKRRKWEELTVKPLQDQRVRQSIVVRYLGEFHKGITPDQVRRVTEDPKASSPLYLRVTAEEMRLHGEHETLDRKINRYVHAADLRQVFSRVLERIEEDYGEERVRDLLCVIWASRAGLSELELLEITGISRMELSRLLFAIDYHFVQREGMWGFFHDYLRHAVEQRYLTENEDRLQLHRRLAAYFGQADPSKRTSTELLYQLHSANDSERLTVELATIPVFMSVYTNETESDVLAYWSVLREAQDVERAYREGLKKWDMNIPDERSNALERIADLLQRLGCWSGALLLQHERLSLAVACHDMRKEADSRARLGWLMQLRGEYSESLNELLKALELFAELDDKRGIAQTEGHLGKVYYSRGEYDRTLQSFQRQLSINQELGDRSHIAKAFADIGVVYARRGDYDRALENFNLLLRISEELGDRSGVAQASGNMGIVYAERGDNDLALESLHVLLRISEELGDKFGQALAYGTLAVVLCNRGEFDRALESYETLLDICEKLGDRRGIARAQGGLGNVYFNRGEFDRALESYRLLVSISEELGDRYGVARGQGNLGMVYQNLGEYDRALECHQVCLNLNMELGDLNGIAYAHGNKGIVYLHRREYDTALEHLHQAAETHRLNNVREPLAIWLLEIAVVLLELATNATTMPEYLPEYVSGVDIENWRNVSLAKARATAEECMDICSELQKPDSIFSIRVLLARIVAAEAHPSVSIQMLATMLTKAANDAQRAELHYWLWKLLGKEEDRNQALDLYRVLFEKTPMNDYRMRIDEIQSSFPDPHSRPPDT